ncbi:MAG: o-succinylbenzoate synthase [Nitriliruptoraceae bacterium]
MATPKPPGTPEQEPPVLAPIAVTAIDLVRVSMPLVRPFTTSFGRQSERDVLLVRVTADRTDAGTEASSGAGTEASGEASSGSGEVVGWGECVTPAAPVYSEEFTDGAALVLREHLVPALVRPGRTLGARDVHTHLAHLHGHRMARAALELAVLDAQLRAADRSLARHLGAVRDRVPVGVSVGIPDGGMPALVEQVAGYLDQGYLRVKVKIRPGFDVAPVTRLREVFGPEVALQVDANAAYDPDEREDLAALDALDELGLVLLEQPFGPARLRDHARHAARWRTPVCLDESIQDAADAADAIALGACRIVNIKLGRVGGMAEALRIRDVCRAAAVPVWCGGMLETGIGRAANLALAATEGFDLPADTSASDRYWHEDLTAPFHLDDGHLAVPTGPGIGRTPRPGALEDAEVVRLLG